MTAMTTTVERQAPALPPANNSQHKTWRLIHKGGGHISNDRREGCLTDDRGGAGKRGKQKDSTARTMIKTLPGNHDRDGNVDDSYCDGICVCDGGW